MRPTGEETAYAAGPTALRSYLPHSLVATAVVAALPLYLAFFLGPRIGVAATVISIGASIALGRIGAFLWQHHSGSRDVVFNDLLLWGYIRRIRARDGLMRNATRLGLQTGTLEGRLLTLDEQTRMLKKLAVSLETGDPYTNGHSQRVARHAYMIAKALRLPRSMQEKVRLAGTLHDVGKLRVPIEILHKPGALTPSEYEVIKEHAETGARMVSLLADPELTRMVRQHHERLDGSGYPSNLHDDEICIGARILAVADTFDAASSQRPYRDAKPHKVAIDILKKDAGTRLDAEVVDAFLSYYGGRRSMKWWAMAWSSPGQMHDVAFFVMQRLGATGLANAAVVGVAAATLAPGSLMHPHARTAHEELARHNSHTAIERVAEHIQTGDVPDEVSEAPSESGARGHHDGSGHSHRSDHNRRDAKHKDVVGHGLARGHGSHGHESQGHEGQGHESHDPTEEAGHGNGVGHDGRTNGPEPNESPSNGNSDPGSTVEDAGPKGNNGSHGHKKDDEEEVASDDHGNQGHGDDGEGGTAEENHGNGNGNGNGSDNANGNHGGKDESGGGEDDDTAGTPAPGGGDGEGAGTGDGSTGGDEPADDGADNGGSNGNGNANGSSNGNGGSSGNGGGSDSGGSGNGSGGGNSDNAPGHDK